MYTSKFHALALALALGSLHGCPPDSYGEFVKPVPPKRRWADPVWLNDAFLDAVRQVESGGNDMAISPKGARGPYQFVEATWKDHARGEPFDSAFDPVASRKVCRDYYLWLSRTISNYTGLPASKEQCLAAYNGGYGRLKHKSFDWLKMPPESVDYVRKVQKELGE